MDTKAVLCAQSSFASESLAETQADERRLPDDWVGGGEVGMMTLEELGR